MQHVTVPLTPVLLIPDGVHPAQLVPLLTDALMKLSTDQLSGAAVEMVQIGRTTKVPAHSATCRVGGHTYYPQPWRTQNLDICTEHAQGEWWTRARAEHAPLFEAITFRTGLRPALVYSGGRAIFQILHDPHDEVTYPQYQGCVEARQDSGHWIGGIEYLASQEQREAGQAPLVVESTYDRPLYPHEWAGKLAEHYDSLNRR